MSAPDAATSTPCRPLKTKSTHLCQRFHRQYGHRRFRLATRRRFDTDFGDAQGPMKDILNRVDVLNAGVWNVTLAAKYPAFAHDHLVGVEPVAE